METNKFKIGIIGECQNDIDDFKSFFENDFEVIEIELSKDINEIISNIFKSNVDSVVIGFKLTEHNSNIGFTGDEVYNYLINEYYKFPAFILTNYVPEAIESRIDDKFKIIPKRWILTGSNEGNELIAKIKTSIKKYKQFIKDSEEEILYLIDKKNKNLITAKEEERLIELDTILEKIISKESAIPKQMKNQKTELSNLVNLAKEILKKINYTHKREIK